MRFIYNLAIFLYGFAIKMASIYNHKAKKIIVGRKNILAKIKAEIEPGNIIWIHAASVGEFEQARPLIEKIKTEYPLKKILITFFSPSGYELRKNYELANYVFYLPQDSRKNAKLLIEIIKPEMVFFVKYEFWYNYINELHRKNIPLFLISGIFRPSQIFFQPYGKWFAKHLKYFTHLFVQDSASSKLLKTINIDISKNVTIAGDTRFDRVFENTKSPKDFKKVKDFCANSFTLICGSTWNEDEKIISEFFKNCKEKIKLIIAPHETTEINIQHIEQFFDNHKVMRWSKLQNTETVNNDFQILIIDSVGQLMHLYQYSTVAYIGGGFGAGIHNILEAACFGKPIFFGPKYKKFKEAIDLIQLGGAETFSNQEDFNEKMNKMLENKIYQEHKSKICKEYVTKNIGATEKIFTYCFK